MQYESQGDFDFGDAQSYRDNQSHRNTFDNQNFGYGQGFGVDADNEALGYHVRQTALREQHQEETRNLLTEAKKLGGNFLPVKDPSSPPYSSFYVMISGHIQSGALNDRDGICCSFAFHQSKDWNLIAGNNQGVSQHAFKAPQTNRRVVWNFPFELTYRSFNISGWPQMTLTFTSRDFLGRDVICGYGVTNVPTQPGTHMRYVHVFSPISSSYLSDFLGMLTGKPAEYISPTELLYKNEGREVTRVQSMGNVKVQFNITMKNLEKFGIYPEKVQ